MVVIGKDSGKHSADGIVKRRSLLTRGVSPDPALTGIQIAQTVRGIQSAGVIACAKHYIGNEQEHFRQVPEAAGYGDPISDALSSNIDDITMHELYLW